AGAGDPGRRGSAAAALGDEPRGARRRHDDLLAALRRYGDQGIGPCLIDAAWHDYKEISRRLQATGAAAQGIPAAPPRSLADVADADATALSRAAGAVPVAQLLRLVDRDRADHTGYRDGGGPARGRPRLADDLGRRRRGPGCDRAASSLQRHPRQGRSG